MTFVINIKLKLNQKADDILSEVFHLLQVMRSFETWLARFTQYKLNGGVVLCVAACVQ